MRIQDKYEALERILDEGRGAWKRDALNAAIDLAVEAHRYACDWCLMQPDVAVRCRSLQRLQALRRKEEIKPDQEGS